MAERQKALEGSRLISEQAEDTFQNLWAEILVLVREAQSKGWQLDTNGSPLARTVSMVAHPRPRNELRITLQKDKQQIAISGIKSPTKLSFAVCEDGVVCLKHDGREVSLRDAARLIIEPFLFPESGAAR